MRSLLPIATVVAVIVAVWYLAAAILNAPLQRDAYANADRAGLFDAGSHCRFAQHGAAEAARPASDRAPSLYKLVLATAPTSKRSLVYHGWITLEETLIGFAIGAALGIVLAV